MRERNHPGMVAHMTDPDASLSADVSSQSQSSAIDLTGRELADGRYHVQSRLGGGSMGFVYRALDRRLDAPVVIKTPTLARLESENFLRRFYQESKFLVRLRHPHIISILDVGEVDKVPFFVMQFVGGGSLEDKQKRKGKRQPMSRKTLARWLPQVASALDFMHAEGYVHRDVKPGNILFDDHGNPYLSDFGLSKILAPEDETDSGQTAAGAVVGTPNYVAPELVLGRSFDGHADQYSLAITVYEILTGQVPFQGPSASATMVNQVSQKAGDPRKLNSRIPEGLALAILKGMSKKQENRFDSCTQFAEVVLEQSRDANSESSESWLASGATLVADGPQFESHGKSKISKGQAACKGCQTKLAIRKEFAGRKGKCKQCGMRMAIAKNLKNVEFFVPLDPRVTPSKSADDEFSLIFAQKAFGFEFDATTAMVIVSVLMALILAGGGLAFVLSQKDAEAERNEAAGQSKIYVEGHK